MLPVTFTHEPDCCGGKAVWGNGFVKANATADNPTNKNPAPTTGAVDRLYASTRLYRDGSHWRIRNITAGYTFDRRIAHRVGAQSIRLYGTAQDPYIHTDYIGIDPEVGGSVPTLRTLLIGSNIVW